MSLTDVPVVPHGTPTTGAGAPAEPAAPRSGRSGQVPWQGLVETLDEVVLVLNPQNVIAYASPSAREHLGLPEQRLAGRAFGDLVHPDDLRTALRALAGLLAAGSVHEALRVRRADGAYTWLEWSLTRARAGDGGQPFTVLTGREGGTRVTLEERLAAVDRRYRALVGALGEAVVVVDGGLCVEEVNAAAAALLGREPHELLGRGWLDAVDVRDEHGARQGAPSGAAPGFGPAERDTWCTLTRGDGRTLPVRTRWTPLDAVPGGSCGFVVTLQGSVGAGGPSLPQQRRQARTAAGLTPREHEVLERLADGQDAMEIARELRLSVYSVRGHIKSLMRKLGVHSQLQAVVVAARRGIVDVLGEEHGSP